MSETTDSNTTADSLESAPMLIGEPSTEQRTIRGISACVTKSKKIGLNIHSVGHELERVSHSTGDDSALSKSSCSLLGTSRRRTGSISTFWKSSSNEILENLVAAVVRGTFSKLNTTEDVSSPWHGACDSRKNGKFLFSGRNLIVGFIVVVGRLDRHVVLLFVEVLVEARNDRR